MPEYKLTYFNVRARAEVSRMLFAVAGVKYEDIRLNGEQWKVMKASGGAPFGQLPILEVDGKKFAQSDAINRFLARELGLSPSASDELCKVDMVVDEVDDLLDKLIPIMSAKDEEQKAAIKKKWLEEEAPKTLRNLETFLKTNKGGDGWFVGAKVSLADLHFQNWMDFPKDQLGMNFDLNGFPLLQALKQRVEHIPGIKKWFEERPSI